MTPQDKAKELYNKYHDEFIGNWDLGLQGTPDEVTFCKKCALIAVEHLIAEERLWMNNTYSTENSEWEKVKQEIEKL